MFLRGGFHLVISPVSTSAVQTAATATYLITPDRSSHDHCQSSSFTSHFSRRGRDSLKVCSDAGALTGRSTLAPPQEKLVSFLSSPAIKTRLMGRENSHNNNSALSFLHNSVQRQGLQLYHQSNGSSIRFSSSYSQSRLLDCPDLVGINNSSTLRKNRSTNINMLGMMQFSSQSSQGSDHNSGSKGPTNDDGSSGGRKPLVVTMNDGLETRESAAALLGQLSDHQKQLIYHTLNIEILRDKYEGHLGSSRQESHSYLSKFGRPATVNEDPTGTLCEVSPKWLHARLDEKSPPAPASAIWAVTVKNALPFVGFGFLDNLIMILAGDYIDITIGTALGISTMAAAALGNAISDVAGVGSAWYVEKFASKIGIRDPDLTPSQMASGAVRWACNLGRALGVTIGCLLGMFPLLFLPSPEDKAKRPSKKGKDEGSNGDQSDKKKFE